MESLVRKDAKTEGRPIIGIMTQPLSGGFVNISGTEYIPASYVKWVEAGGARVVPVRFTASREELREVLSQINGLLLPGGGASLEPHHHLPFYDAVEFLWNIVMEEAYSKKAYFPIWGTCQGFEQISVLAAGSNYSVLSASGNFDGENQAIPLQNLNPSKQRILKDIPPKLLQEIQTEPSTYNGHEKGVTPEVWKTNPNLMKIFGEPVALGHDLKGKAHVAMVESKSPEIGVFGVQFHPEKAVFEWPSNSNIPHNDAGVDFSLYLARFFVKEAKKTTSYRSFKGGPEAESRSLIEHGGRDGKGKRIYLGSTFYFMEMFVW